MAMNVSDHEAVPEHRKMDEEEVEELLEKFDADKEDLPKIKDNDAALKNMEIEIGEVIEITRDSPTAGEAKYYRRVVER